MEEDGGFVFVRGGGKKGRRRANKKIREIEDAKEAGHSVPVDESFLPNRGRIEDEAKLVEEITRIQREVAGTSFARETLSSIREALLAPDGTGFDTIVALGLGDFSESVAARHQLALATWLAEELSIPPDARTIHDPVAGALSTAVAARFSFVEDPFVAMQSPAGDGSANAGAKVGQVDAGGHGHGHAEADTPAGAVAVAGEERGGEGGGACSCCSKTANAGVILRSFAPRGRAGTLFFMPHCPRPLYESFAIEPIRDSSEACRRVLVGNALSRYLERGGAGSKVHVAAKCSAIEKLLPPYPCEGSGHAFVDVAVHAWSDLIPLAD